MKFIPKVGEECYVTHPKGNSNCEILGISGGYVWFKVFNHICFSFLMTECEFKPIKTPTEIERDEAIEKLAGELGELCPSPEVVNKVIYLGYRKQQVKPLSYDEFEEMYFNTSYPKKLYELLKPYTIQGGDK